MSVAEEYLYVATVPSLPVSKKCLAGDAAPAPFWTGLLVAVRRFPVASRAATVLVLLSVVIVSAVTASSGPVVGFVAAVCAVALPIVALVAITAPGYNEALTGHPYRRVAATLHLKHRRWLQSMNPAFDSTETRLVEMYRRARGWASDVERICELCSIAAVETWDTERFSDHILPVPHTAVAEYRRRPAQVADLST